MSADSDREAAMKIESIRDSVDLGRLRQAGCPHCDEWHTAPSSVSWSAWVSEDRPDGQPSGLFASPSTGAHVAESDAVWLRYLLNHATYDLAWCLARIAELEQQLAQR